MSDKMCCPHCGSYQISAVSRQGYNGGCGCLGLLLFGWWGLLLGLLGADSTETVCNNCGARWPVGKPHKGRVGEDKFSCCGCFIFGLILILIFYLISTFMSIYQ